MTRLMITLAVTAATLGGFAVLPAPALAQQVGNQAEVIVYGNDPCPRETESTIVVCRRVPENQRYRLPRSQQLQGSRQERQSWSNRAQAVMNAGKTGINSCSAVGPGGFTGCLTQQIQQARQESREAQQQSAPPEK